VAGMDHEGAEDAEGHCANCGMRVGGLAKNGGVGDDVALFDGLIAIGEFCPCSLVAKVDSLAGKCRAGSSVIRQSFLVGNRENGFNGGKRSKKR